MDSRLRGNVGERQRLESETRGNRPSEGHRHTESQSEQSQSTAPEAARVPGKGDKTMKIFADAATEPVTITPDGSKRQVLSYSKGLMLVQFTFETAGQEAALHSHPHEQVGYVVSGEIELIMEGHGSKRLSAGGSYYVPPNTRHGAKVITPAVVVDAFTPQRDEFL